MTAEWRDIRIRGSYTPVGSGTPRTIDRVFRIAGQVDANGVTTAIQGASSSQDVTPTYTQAQAGESGFNVVSPTASDAFSSGNGTHGLEESSDQPGDLTRMYYGTADATRPHHIGCQRVAPYTALGPGVVGWTGGGGGPVGGSKLLALTEPGNVITGVIVQETGGAYGYYTFNRTTGNFEWLKAAWNPQQAAFSAGGAPSASVDAASLVMLRQIGSKLWAPVNGVAQLKDIVTPAGTVATDNPVIGYLVVGDRLHTYTYLADGSIELNPFDIASDGSLTRTRNSVPADVVGRIKSAGQPVGCCVSNGFMILAAATGIYSVSFSDTNKAYSTSLICDLPLGVTGKPVEWNGDIWVPCGNRLFRFTVGRSGNTWMLVDTHGTLPDLYAGDLVQLFPTPDRLVLRQVRSTTAAAVLSLDGGGAVSTLRWSDASDNAVTGLSEVARNPVIPVLSYGEPFFCVVRWPAALPALADTQIVPNGSRNPSAMPASQRLQVARGHALWPHQYGVNRQAPKTPTRIGLEVDGVGALASLLTVSMYIQRDYENKSVVQTFATGPMAGTGLWHKVVEVGLESLGIDSATGSGMVWTELTDALGNYTNCRHRYRPYFVINGDPTGALFPEVRSFIIQRYEWVNKGYLSAFRLRLQVGDGATTDWQDARKGGVFEDAADVQDALDDIQALNDHFVICTVTPVGMDESRSFKAVLTKYNDDIVHTTLDGKTSVIVSLSAQHVVPSALYTDELL